MYVDFHVVSTHACKKKLAHRNQFFPFLVSTSATYFAYDEHRDTFTFTYIDTHKLRAFNCLCVCVHMLLYGHKKRFFAADFLQI